MTMETTEATVLDAANPPEKIDFSETVGPTAPSRLLFLFFQERGKLSGLIDSYG